VSCGIICSQVQVEIVEIFHCGEGGDIEKVAQISKQISHVCDCFSLSLTHSYNCSYLFTWYLLLYYYCYCFTSYIYSITNAIVHLNSYLKEY